MTDIRFRQLIDQVHCLGPRVMAELLAELGGAHLIRLDIERRLERYAALDPAILTAIGGDRWPGTPLYIVWSDDR